MPAITRSQTAATLFQQAPLVQQDTLVPSKKVKNKQQTQNEDARIRKQDNIRAQQRDVFMPLIRHGCFIHAKKWYKCTDIVDKVNLLDEAFICACERGHIEIANWIVALNHNPINRAFVLKTFRDTCHKLAKEFGKLEYIPTSR